MLSAAVVIITNANREKSLLVKNINKSESIKN